MATEQQEHSLTVLSVVTSALSFVAALSTVITVYLGSFGLFPGVLRGVKVQKISFHLICMVSISDAIRTFGNLFGSPATDSSLCGFQAFLKIFGGVASFAWITVITFVMYKLLLENDKWDRITVQKHKRVFHGICWGFAAINALIPTAMGWYENTSGWCFISGSKSGVLSRLFNYYVWVVIAWFVIVVLYIRIWKFVKDNQIEFDSMPTVNRLMYYPLIFFVCWFWSLLRRSWNVFSPTGQAPVALIGLQIFFSNIYGLCNAILYGWIVRYHLRATSQTISESLGSKDEKFKTDASKTSMQHQPHQNSLSSVALGDVNTGDHNEERAGDPEL